MIRARLAQKGVAPEEAEQAVALLELESPDMDREAALEFARKRRFGAYRRADVLFDDARRRKELGAFARAGHSFELAKSLVDATKEHDDE